MYPYFPFVMPALTPLSFPPVFSGNPVFFFCSVIRVALLVVQSGIQLTDNRNFLYFKKSFQNQRSRQRKS